MFLTERGKAGKSFSRCIQKPFYKVGRVMLTVARIREILTDKGFQALSEKSLSHLESGIRVAFEGDCLRVARWHGKTSCAENFELSNLAAFERQGRLYLGSVAI